MSDFLTSDQVAKKLNVGLDWLRDHSGVKCDDPIPSYQLDGLRRYDWDEVEQWVRSKAQGKQAEVVSLKRVAR